MATGGNGNRTNNGANKRPRFKFKPHLVEPTHSPALPYIRYYLDLPKNGINTPWQKVRTFTWGYNLILRAGGKARAAKIIDAGGQTRGPYFPRFYDWDVVYTDFEWLKEIANRPGDYIFCYGWPTWGRYGKIRRWQNERSHKLPALLPKDVVYNKHPYKKIIEEKLKKTWGTKVKTIARRTLGPSESIFVLDIDGSDLSPIDVKRKLPEPFRNSDCLVQYTASQGIKKGYHFRLWYRIAPEAIGSVITLRDLRWIARQLKSIIPAIDLNIYKPAHPISISAPVDNRVFYDKGQEPVLQRAFILPGEERVAIIDTTPKPVPGPAWYWPKEMKGVTRDPKKGKCWLYFGTHILPVSTLYYEGMEEQRKEQMERDMRTMCVHILPNQDRRRKWDEIPEDEQLNLMLEAAKRRIGVKGHHAQILRYCVLLAKKGYDQYEIEQKLYDVLSECDRMDKSEGEFRAKYFNGRYIRNMARWCWTRIGRRLHPDKEPSYNVPPARIRWKQMEGYRGY